MKVIGNIKKIIFFFLVQCLTVGAWAQEAAIKEAEAAYTKEDYGKAIELYEGLLNSYGESAEIYYNLGNAYYKANKIAPAVLNYERALLLDPGDKDIRFNLQLAQQKAVDKIEPIGDFFLTRWVDQVQNMFAADFRIPKMREDGLPNARRSSRHVFSSGKRYGSSDGEAPEALRRWDSCRSACRQAHK